MVPEVPRCFVRFGSMGCFPAALIQLGPPQPHHDSQKIQIPKPKLFRFFIATHFHGSLLNGPAGHEVKTFYHRSRSCQNNAEAMRCCESAWCNVRNAALSDAVVGSERKRFLPSVANTHSALSLSEQLFCWILTDNVVLFMKTKSKAKLIIIFAHARLANLIFFMHVCGTFNIKTC